MRLPLFLLALLALLAPALGQAQSLDDVEILVERRWPEHLGKGWMPVVVDLHSSSAQARELRLEVTNPYVHMGSKEVFQRVQLGPRESKRVELLVPILDGSDRHMGGMTTRLQVTVRIGSMGQTFNGGGEDWEEDQFPMMVFTERRLSSAATSTFASDVARSTQRPLLHGRALSGSLEPDVGSGSFEDMARHWSAYSSLNVVVVDLDGGVPAPERFEDLLRWVRLGGSLVLAGDPSAAFAAAPSLAGAFEDRFLLGEDDGLTLHRVGLGRIYRVDGAADLQEPRVHRATREAALTSRDAGDNAGRAYVPAPRGWRLFGFAWAIPGVGRLPLRTFMMLLLLFALVIGPINLLVLKKLERPALLLVSIPAISVLASVGLVLYGVLHQGIDTKAVRTSLTHLDQRTSRAAVVERRRLFVGLAQGNRLAPGAGTAVFPEDVGMDDRYRVVRDGGVRLTGSFLPVREQVDQMVLTERAARSGLEFELADGALAVRNTFDATLQRVVVRAPDGGYHLLGSALDPSERGAADRFVPEEGEDVIARRLTRNLLYRDLSLVPGSYAALLERNPLADDCGLDLNVKKQEHLVIGVVSASEEAWR